MSEQLTLFAEDSPAKILASAGQATDLTANGRGFGGNTGDSLASFDPHTSSWRTAQICLTEAGEIGLAKYSGVWPRSGTMRNGTLFPRAILEPHISVKGSGLLPTPLASDNRDRGDLSNPSIQRRLRIGKQVSLSSYFKGEPCPLCVEGMMGLPMGWTDCTP
jgi:hypothetical protein